MLREELHLPSPNRRQLRSFGITLGIALLVIAGVLYWRTAPGVIAVSSIGVLLLVVGFVAPAILGPLYKPWMALAVLLGFIMTRILLTLIFVLLFIPTGLLMRLFGRDPLRRKLDPDAKTYWIRKQYNPESRERLERYY
jgi:Mg2+/Co2+ transporter CorB